MDRRVKNQCEYGGEEYRAISGRISKGDVLKIASETLRRRSVAFTKSVNQDVSYAAQRIRTSLKGARVTVVAGDDVQPSSGLREAKVLRIQHLILHVEPQLM